MTELDEAADISRDGAGSTGIDPIHFPERVGEFDHDRIVAAVREILIGIGEDPDRDGLRETPERVAGRTPKCTAACGRIRRRSWPPSSTSATTSWSWSRTSKSGAPANTTSCHSPGSPTSATSPTEREDHRAQQAGSPG